MRTLINQKNGAGKMDLMFIILFLLGWIALQAWILPRFGVST